ncbi:MAG TPA: hypothetical protein VF713_25530 [Thermoanaerobaculia bacterium]
MAGYLKGALIQFMETFLIPLPNVILFQYNPETMTHTWTPAPSAAGSTSSAAGSNPLAVSGVPGETFTFSIVMNSNETIADGSAVTAGIASISGVYSRIAALEMLQYPVSSDAGGSLAGSISVSAGGLSIGGSAGGGVNRSVPGKQVPTVLFVWGPGRIVPVRVAALTVTEKLFDGLLNPTHVEASLTLKVLTPEELASVNGPLKDIAKGAYEYSQGLRQALAIANLANATESVIGLLPI